MPTALDEQEKANIVERLFIVFRDRGYDGTSIADLSAATGLGKSSLYHHFPRGKEQMAEVVLEHGRSFMQHAIVDVAKSPAPLKDRIRKVATALDQLYAGGRNSCVLQRLSAASVGSAGRQIACEIFEMWTAAVAELARDSGMSSGTARQFAEDWVARVQGALILHSAIGDRKPFGRALGALRELADNHASQRARAER